MSSRLILQGGTNPFRIVTPGGNPSNFTDVLFDGNSRAFRTLMSNVISVADTTSNVLYSDWTVCNFSTVPLGKTFSSPPLATFVFNQNNVTPQYASPYFEWSETDLSGSATFSEFGMGLAITVNTLYVWNGYRTVSPGTAHTAAYLVFDLPMGE